MFVGKLTHTHPFFVKEYNVKVCWFCLLKMQPPIYTTTILCHQLALVVIDIWVISTSEAVLQIVCLFVIELKKRECQI